MWHSTRGITCAEQLSYYPHPSLAVGAFQHQARPSRVSTRRARCICSLCFIYLFSPLIPHRSHSSSALNPIASSFLFFFLNDPPPPDIPPFPPPDPFPI